MLKELNKFQKAKIIVSALYNLNYVCTSLNKIQWRDAKSLSKKSYETVHSQYLKALDVLQAKGEKEKTDIIGEWVKQSVEGEQI